MREHPIRARRAMCAAFALLAACGAGASRSSPADNSGSSGGGGHDVGSCFQDSDCPAGLVCQNQTCVASDGLPPEQKSPGLFQEPKTTAHYVFALSPDNDQVAVIDPLTLAIRSIDLPHEPMGIEVVPGQDAVVIVARAGESVSYLACDPAACTLESQPTARHYPAVSVSGDGQWALLWTPDPNLPDQGAEGIVGVVDLAKLAAGAPAAIVERATGRRDTNAFFRVDSSGKAVDAAVVAEDDIAVIDLANLASEPLPLQIPLPADYTSVASRQAAAAPDGSTVVLRSFASQDVGVLDVAGRTFHRLTVPGTPSDLELTADGHTAIAVLRDTGEVSLIPLPQALSDPSAITSVPVSLAADGCASPDGGSCAVFPGQAALSPDGKRAALFTNAENSKSFAVLDLATGAATTFDGLEKWVDTLGIGPDGQTVVVLHRPNPGSTAADSYQRMVDVSQGYSVVDLAANAAQLKLTDQVPPQQFVFSSDAAHAAVTLSDDVHSIFSVDAIDLRTLVTSSLALASKPQYAGAFAGNTPLVWVTQDHPAGRISFVDLASKQVRTATGYALNSGISQ